MYTPRDGNPRALAQGLMETLRRERPDVMYEDVREFSKVRAACACSGLNVISVPGCLLLLVHIYEYYVSSE